MAGEYGNVRSAIAERGYKKGNYVETVEKILTETSVQDCLFQIFVGGGDDANIHAGSLIGAYWFETLLFEHAQHFRLRAQTHVANFVEEKSTAVGLLEFADLVVHGSGETTFDVAEKFGLDEFFGDGGAIDFYEWAFVAEAGGVERTSD